MIFNLSLKIKIRIVTYLVRKTYKSFMLNWIIMILSNLKFILWDLMNKFLWKFNTLTTWTTIMERIYLWIYKLMNKEMFIIVISIRYKLMLNKIYQWIYKLYNIELMLIIKINLIILKSFCNKIILQI